MKVLVILTGSGTITSADEIAADFRAGDCLLVPAVYEGAMRFAEDSEYLLVRL